MLSRVSSVSNIVLYGSRMRYLKKIGIINKNVELNYPPRFIAKHPLCTLEFLNHLCQTLHTIFVSFALLIFRVLESLRNLCSKHRKEKTITKVRKSTIVDTGYPFGNFRQSYIGRIHERCTTKPKVLVSSETQREKSNMGTIPLRDLLTNCNNAPRLDHETE